LKYKRRILDALDVETFLLARDEGEAKGIMEGLLAELGFADHDIVFLEQVGCGVRVRARAYVHRPGVSYGWLAGGEQ
jgi:hypothetical protein